MWKCPLLAKVQGIEHSLQICTIFDGQLVNINQNLKNIHTLWLCLLQGIYHKELISRDAQRDLCMRTFTTDVIANREN